jgi:hypothetical protein
MSGTEDSILNNIPDLDSDSDGGGSDVGSQGSQTSDGGGHSSAPPSQSVDGRSSGGNTGDQTQPVIRRRHDGLEERPNPENPNTRDLVDPVTGRIVAKGGIERRVFEEGQRHSRENQTLRQQLQVATQQLQGHSEVSRVATELALPAESQVVAMRVMADFMRDPVKTLEMLVAEVKSKGYQIPFLEQGVTPGMDLNAIQRMIDAKMAPITQRAQLEQQQQQERANAQRILDGFLSTHPEAEVNLGTLAQMMQAQPGLSIHDAYVKMATWSVSNGLDHTQPLEAQIQALQNNPQPTQQQQPPIPQRPLPNGRSAQGNGTQGVDATRQFNENTSWSDIIRHSMEESGLSLR